MQVEKSELSELLLFLFYNKGRCVVYISYQRKESLQPSGGVISNCWWQINGVPLNVKVGIEEAALPQSCDLFRFLLCGISRHRGEHHHSPALLGQFQQFFRFGGVHFGEVNGRRSPLVLGKVPFFNVIILLWDRVDQLVLLRKQWLAMFMLKNTWLKKTNKHVFMPILYQFRNIKVSLLLEILPYTESGWTDT